MAEPTRWRRAGADDVVALRDLEREASLAGLAHVFGERPFPDDDVLARWALVLADPGSVVEVAIVADREVALVAYDAWSVRHLAVASDHWGRGLGRQGIERALAGIEARPARLWCLHENHRARALYERLGWQPSGPTRECPWPPFPVEIELTLG